MKIKALLLSTIFAACIIPSLAQAAKTEEGKGEKKAPDPAKMFAKLDADESGELSKEEVAKNKGLVKNSTNSTLTKAANSHSMSIRPALAKKRKSLKRIKKTTPATSKLRYQYFTKPGHRKVPGFSMTKPLKYRFNRPFPEVTRDRRGRVGRGGRYLS